jgi:predicted nucleic acid-binding protein
VTPLRRRTGPPPSVEVVGALRVCLDLNVWCAPLLSEKEGRSNTASQLLASAAAAGFCALRPTQLVISWGMLGRMEQVLVTKLRVPASDARWFIEQIARSATAAPAGHAPYLVLGGTAVVPLHDEEDAGVLETALAGRAEILVTGNMADFVNYRTEVLKPGLIALHRAPEHEVVIAHPAEVAAWIRTGEIVLG